jgi:protein SCO1/2
MRNTRFALWGAVGVALVVFLALSSGVFRFNNTPPAGVVNAGTSLQHGAPLGGAFSLVDSKGQPVTEALLREKPSAVFFGFTHCPDICPTTLSEVSSWIEALGPDAEGMRFVFVTVDPERDTPEVMREYLSAFSDRIIGVTGDPARVHDMVRDYKIYSRKVPLEGGGYTMDHSASVLLLDPAGAFVGTIAQDESREAALAKLQRLGNG